jgi:hypothetical protein
LTVLLDHAPQLSELEASGVFEVLLLDGLVGSHAAQVPVADALELADGLLGSQAPHVPEELAATLELDGLLGSQAPHVPVELADTLELDGLLGSHAAQVPEAEELELADGLLGSHGARVVAGSAGEPVVDHASQSLCAELYGQLVWVGAHEVMVTSTVSVRVTAPA